MRAQEEHSMISWAMLISIDVRDPRYGEFWEAKQLSTMDSQLICTFFD